MKGNTRHTGDFCSHKCADLHKKTGQIIHCPQCNKKFYCNKAELKKTKFCGQSCAATYNNHRKKTGTRISKLELFLQKELSNRYPKIEFQFNKKDVIQSELDIYIPVLKIAFEINGIFHYKPIFGKNKLRRVKNNDRIKKRSCIKNGIELRVINSSSLDPFHPEKAKKYLNSIGSIIENRRCGPTRTDT